MACRRVGVGYEYDYDYCEMRSEKDDGAQRAC